MVTDSSTCGWRLCLAVLALCLAGVPAGDATAAPACTSQVIATTSGQLCGLTLHTAAGRLNAYLGVPYAQSPAGENRWKPPVPVRPRAGLVSAKSLGPSCPQKIGSESFYEQDEDCLTLNVWTPAPGNHKRPIMVFIHGGAFVEGTSASPLYDGSNLASGGDVVVVTFNYRLGALGFLYGVEGLKGNYGFLDQQLALRWVRANARKIGGDPNNITLFGESAGAMSIGLHMVAPASRNLFRAAIMQSNPYGLPYRFADETQRTGRKIRRNLGCSLNRSARALECMRQAPLRRILKYQSSPGLVIKGALSGFSDILLWAPIIDGTIITRQPVAVRPTKPLIIGTNEDEGLTFAALLEEKSRTISKRAYRAALRVLFKRKTAKLIRSEPAYRPVEGDNTEVFARATTDYLFTCASRHVLSRARSKSFGYEFTKQSSYDMWPGLEPCAPKGEKSKACHGFELPYVFGNPFTLSAREGHKLHIFKQDETDLSKMMKSYWTRFARRHDPNGYELPSWPAHTSNRPYVHVLDTPVKGLHHQRTDCALWDNIGYGERGLFGRL